MNLTLTNDHLTVCQLPPGAAIPDWAAGTPGFSSITRTDEELSIVCAAASVPPAVTQESGWRLLKVEGPLDFGLTGILASLTDPLAKAGLSLFALSTYDTDYLLVKAVTVDAAVETLRRAGHTVQRTR